MQMNSRPHKDLTEALAFDEFFRASKDQVLRAVIVSTGGWHDAEDCVAEAFTRALKDWPMVSKLQTPSSWVVQVARNLHIDRHRKYLRTVKLFPAIARKEVVHEQVPGLDPALLAAINSLPERQREVLAYRVLLELNAKETATALSISVATVGTHLHRALETLRTNLDNQRKIENGY